MSNISEMVKDRATSGFELSIGTSLAIESIFNLRKDPYDKDRKIPNRIKLSDYDVHYYNIQTLIRNIISSVIDKKVLLSNIPETISVLTDTVLEEITYLADLYEDPEASKTEFKVYMLNYDKIVTNTKLINYVRVPNTDLQILMSTLINGVISKIVGIKGSGVIYNYSIPNKYRNVLVTTGISFDLLPWYRFSKFNLLESHTGVLKTRLEFNTKYYSIAKQSMDRFPFQEKLLYMLGDNSLFKPMNIKVRRKLYQLAQDNKWTSVSTVVKIEHYLKNDDELYQIYKSLPKLV